MSHLQVVLFGPGLVPVCCLAMVHFAPDLFSLSLYLIGLGLLWSVVGLLWSGSSKILLVWPWFVAGLLGLLLRSVAGILWSGSYVKLLALPWYAFALGSGLQRFGIRTLCC
ncbi:hypothetical protein U1Q18_011467 [Sarracenia purpurea var. burkii]